MDLQEEKRKTQEQFRWEDQSLLDRAWERYLQREAFSYDPEKDPLYRQYAQRYTQLGKLAMEDAVGTASALTGGYANSYAQTVGQQAYNGYMQRLSDVLPELYGDAYDRYKAEGEALYDEVVLRQEQRNRAYQEYLDQQAWQNKLEQQAYQKEQDALALQLKQEQLAYEKEQDLLKWQQSQEQQRYQQEKESYSRILELIAAGYRPTDEELAQVGMTRAQADALVSSAMPSSGSSGGGGSSGSSGSSVTYDTHGYKKADIKALQEAAGLVVDGIWGPETQSAYEAGWRREGTAGTQRVSASILQEHSLTPHELVAYGSYEDYVAYTILSSGLTDREEDYLFRVYREEHPEFGSGWGGETHLQRLRDRGLI